MSLFRRVSILVSTAALLLGVIIPLAAAQDSAGDGSSGLLVSPTRTEITSSPGEQKNFKVTLKNITKNEITAKAFINDFESDNESGTPQIIVDTTQRTPNTISNMVKGLSDINLKPNETKELNLTLDIPGNAPPGAYYGALRFAAVPKGQNLDVQDQRQVALTASVAHLVFVELSGDITQQIQIEKLQLQKGNSASTFFFKAPDKAALGIKNLGNGFSRPFGSVSIKDFRSKEVYKYDVNNTDPKGIILPNSSRTFSNEVKNVKTPGRYTATAAVAYGNGGEVATYKNAFWYLPAWFIAAVLLIIAAIIGVIYYTYKKQRPSAAKKRTRSK